MALVAPWLGLVGVVIGALIARGPGVRPPYVEPIANTTPPTVAELRQVDE